MSYQMYRDLGGWRWIHLHVSIFLYMYMKIMYSINSGSGSLSETTAYRMHGTVWWVIFVGCYCHGSFSSHEN